jgi:hypothetical protein
LQDNLDKYTFTTLVINGSSSHTAQTPGSITKATNEPGTLNSVGLLIIKTTNIKNDITMRLKNENNFNVNQKDVKDIIEDDLNAIEKIFNILLKYFIDNTKVTAIEVTGGVTSITGTLTAPAEGKAGLFI